MNPARHVSPRRPLLALGTLLGALPMMGLECDRPTSGPFPRLALHLTLTPAEPGVEESFTLDPSATEAIEVTVRIFEYRIDAGAVPDPANEVFRTEQVADFPTQEAVPLTTSLPGGQYTATVIAHYRDEFGRDTSKEASVTFWVSDCGPAPYADAPPGEIDDETEHWSSGRLPAGVAGSPYDAHVPVNGGVDPLVFEVADPEGDPFPDWLTLWPDGRLTADEIPAGARSDNVTIRVFDGCFNGARSVVLEYVLQIVDAECGPNPVFHGFDVTELNQGYYYALTAVVENGQPPFSLVLPDGGEIPSELNMEIYGDATLAGRPQTTGTFVFEIGVLDHCFRRDFASVTFTVVEPQCEKLLGNREDPERATVGEPYTTTIWTGGFPPVSYEVVSVAQIPPGLALDAASGILSGVPTEAGQFYLVLEVEDSCPDGVQSILEIANVWVDPAPGDCSPLSVITQKLPGGLQGEAYEASIETEGGEPPLHFQELGTLPPGLTLDYDTGVISGTPTTPGLWTFDLLVYDSCQPEVQQVTTTYGIGVE